MIDGRLFERLRGFYPDRCTIQAATETLDEAGQITPAWGDVTGLVDLRCRIAPVGGSERKSPTAIWSTATHVVNLAGGYEGIVTKMRAVVTKVGGEVVTLDILQAGRDGFGESTRLVGEVVGVAVSEEAGMVGLDFSIAGNSMYVGAV